MRFFPQKNGNFLTLDDLDERFFFCPGIKQWLIVGLGPRWFGFLESPKMKGIGILKGTLRIPNHRAPNQQLTISWWDQNPLGLKIVQVSKGFLAMNHQSFLKLQMKKQGTARTGREFYVRLFFVLVFPKTQHQNPGSQADIRRIVPWNCWC